MLFNKINAEYVELMGRDVFVAKRAYMSWWTFVSTIALCYTVSLDGAHGMSV